MSEENDHPINDTPTSDTPATDHRAWARKRIEKRRGLQTGSVAYVVVNVFLIGAWAMNGGGYFWPGWVIGGWGVGMLLGWWDYLRGSVTEADIDRELRGRQ